MGNIIKFDLDVFPQFWEPEGKDHWQQIKDEWIQKYGDDEHAAALAIAREIGLPENCVLAESGRNRDSRVSKPQKPARRSKERS